jgi:hypothetical protein
MREAIKRCWSFMRSICERISQEVRWRRRRFALHGMEADGERNEKMVKL